MTVDGAPPKPDALPPGMLFGSLRIDRPLARGASAVLYAATDTQTQVPVALKVLCPPADDAVRANDAFLRDAQQATTLLHPNIVRVFGGGQVRGIAFMAMELLPGSDLSRWATGARRLPEAAVLEIAAQLADALDHAHRHGVVHRDVKPANVIYDPASRRAVLTDFGLARLPDAQATRSGLFLGSPAYMAPELLGGAPPSSRSDLYALGVLTWELLAGRRPFDQPTLGALLRAVASQPPPALRDARPDIAAGDALDALLAPLLAKAADERLGDAREWAKRARVQHLWLTAPPAT